MKKMQMITACILLAACVFLPTQAVHAGGLQDGRVIFGDNYTLASGDTLNGDLVVFGGNVTVEAEAVVEGDMVVIGGNVSLDGILEGSAVLIGGSIKMGETAVVDGDLVTVGGSLQREPGARVEGDVVTNIPAPDIQIPDFQAPDIPTPLTPIQPDLWGNFNPMMDVLQMLVTAIAIALLAALGTLFLQPQIERVSQAIVGQPVIAGSFGLLTVVLAPIMLVILAVTIILIPVVVLAAAVLALAWLFGVIAIGFEVGERFTKAINQTWAVPFVAAFGTFLMMVVVGGIGMIPCVGLLAPFLVALLGMGGVILTFFGTRSYPRVVMPPMSEGMKD